MRKSSIIVNYKNINKGVIIALFLTIKAYCGIISTIFILKGKFIMRFGNERNNIEFNTEFLEDVVKTGTKLLSKGIELGKALLGSNNYKVNPTTGEVELIGNFSKQTLERVQVLTFKDEKGEQAIEFLKLAIAPGTRSAIITDFTTNKKRFDGL